MDNLFSLPSIDTKLTDEEKKTLVSVFGSELEHIKAPQSPDSLSWKTVGVNGGLFILAANPWLDNLFDKIPSLSNPILRFLIRVFVFVFLTTGYMWWSNKKD